MRPFFENIAEAIDHFLVEIYLSWRLFIYPDQFPYRCAYCGKPTSMPEYEDHGRRFTSCCGRPTCIARWQSKVKREDFEVGDGFIDDK